MLAYREEGIQTRKQRSAKLINKCSCQLYRLDRLDLGLL